MMESSQPQRQDDNHHESWEDGWQAGLKKVKGQDLIGDFALRSWTSLTVSRLKSNSNDADDGSANSSGTGPGAYNEREDRIVAPFSVKKNH